MKISAEKKICIEAFVVRLLCLLLTFQFSNYLSLGFLGSTTDQDDVRYTIGAETYAQTASNIIDIDAFAYAFLSIGDDTGVADIIPFWYAFVCLITYLTQTIVSAHIVNILFAVVSVLMIYRICNAIYDKKIALLAARLYAFLPYPVIFSCFLYKDQLYTMLVLIFLYLVIKLKNTKLTTSKILILCLLLLIMTSVRTGLSVIVAALFMVYYLKDIKFSPTALFAMVVAGALVVGGVLMSIDDILYKYDSYIGSGHYEEISTGYIKYIRINTLLDFYRFPIAYIFAIVQPINLSRGIMTWMGLAGVFSFLTFTIVIGNTLYLVFIRIKKDALYWITLFLMFITFMASLGIIRHMYYLYPFYLISFSCFWCRYKKSHLFILISALLFSILYILFQFLLNF